MSATVGDGLRVERRGVKTAESLSERTENQRFEWKSDAALWNSKVNGQTNVFVCSKYEKFKCKCSMLWCEKFL